MDTMKETEVGLVQLTVLEAPSLRLGQGLGPTALPELTVGGMGSPAPASVDPALPCPLTSLFCLLRNQLNLHTASKY